MVEACENCCLHLAGRSQHGVLGVGPVVGTQVSRFRAVVGLPAPSCVHRVSAGAQHCAVLARSPNEHFRVWGCGDAPFLAEDDAKMRHSSGENSSENPSGGEANA